ncbi:MAG TPA: hypothetical protein VIP11_24830 [Gemmatimonadaceae bacterium]
MQSLQPGAAVYPQLCFRLGVSLRKMAVGGASEGTEDIQIHGFQGELRLGQHNDAVGSLTRIGELRSIRSSVNGYESQVELACDLDLFRIELIERRRAGAPPPFWMQLWVTASRSGEELSLSIPSIQLHVQHASWLAFVAFVGAGEYEIVEVRYGPAERDYFKRGLERIREARNKITEGEYDEAVSLCRKVLEAAGHDLTPGKSDSALKDLFIRSAGDKRGAEYAGILSKVKQLAGFVHHDFGAALTYSRSEAQFVVRVTESLLSLASYLAAHTSEQPPANDR